MAWEVWLSLMSGNFSTLKIEWGVYNKDGVIIFLYVDDMLIYSTSMNINVLETKIFLTSTFHIKCMSKVKVILSIKIIRNCEHFILSYFFL